MRCRYCQLSPVISSKLAGKLPERLLHIFNKAKSKLSHDASKRPPVSCPKRLCYCSIPVLVQD